jgi:mono/diheme cytochrome c family protein
MGWILRWSLRGLAALAILAALALAGLYVNVAIELGRRWPVTTEPVPAASGPAAVAAGARLATIFGCNDCHGADLRGQVLVPVDWSIGRFWAANATLAAAQQSDGQLAATLRTGVTPDGRGMVVMPSESFSRLSDAETADIIAYVRSLPKGGPERPGIFVGPVGALGAALGEFQTAPQLVAEANAHPLPDFGPAYAQGRSLARACVACHGVDLKGDPATGGPDLRIAAAYDLPSFERLLHTGVALDGKTRPLMSPTALARFSGLSSDEVKSLHDYLAKRVEAQL